MKRITVPLLLSVVLALAACKDKPVEAPPAPAAPKLQGNRLSFTPGHPQLSQLGVVEAKTAGPVAVDLPARLVWNEDRTQRIYPAFAGRVAAIQVDLGQSVKAGSVLAQLASPDFGVAQADTAKAQADSQFTQRALARQRELFEAGVVARKDMEQAEADAARARAEVQRAEARTRLYGAAGAAGVDQRLAVVSGIAGTVVERNVNPGQELRPDQMGAGAPPLFVVSDPSSLWVMIDARESETAALRPGTTFELAVPSLPGEKFSGKVVAVGDFVDPGSRTLRVRGLVANPDRRLKAEMLATARVMRSFGAGVVVPAKAVSLEGTSEGVMVEVAPGVFERREVDVSYQGKGEAVIASGLKAGEKVVAENSLLLSSLYRAAQKALPRAPASAASAATPAPAAASAAAPASAAGGKP